MKILRFFLYLVIFLVFSLVALALLVPQSQPWVTASAQQQLQGADSLQALRWQARFFFQQRNVPQRVIFSAEQVNTLWGTLSRGLPTLHGQTRMDNAGMLSALSYRLPKPFDAYYVNLRANLASGPQLQLTDVQLGPVSLPGSWIKALLLQLADIYLRADIASEAATRVERIQSLPGRVIVHLHPVGDLLERVRQLQPRELSAHEQVFRQRIQVYLTYLQSLPAPASNATSAYLAPLFQRVMQESTSANAVQENQAALLALAAFDSHRLLRRYLDLDMADNVGPSSPMQLAGRRDLHLHFVLSAALEILSNQGLGLAIGELKEMMDTGLGGSGFSFTDLAADMAGVRLANALRNPEQARDLQQRLAAITDESMFFPVVSDLPEHLSKTAFNAQYGGLDSPEYRQWVALIEQRLNALWLYR